MLKEKNQESSVLVRKKDRSEKWTFIYDNRQQSIMGEYRCFYDDSNGLKKLQSSKKNRVLVVVIYSKESQEL